MFSLIDVLLFAYHVQWQIFPIYLARIFLPYIPSIESYQCMGELEMFIKGAGGLITEEGARSSHGSEIPYIIRL